ncbi:MAG: aminoacyl-tRNA hydrolase [Patescibacteria group bacterium]
MYLIVGLGNPGQEYENTKHNIGREIVEKCAKKCGVDGFEFDKKSNALVAQAKIEKEKVIFALPETFMNKSGLAVSALAKFYKVKPAAIFVVHDDVDLPAGKIKISFARSSAGHKGVEHIIKNLKTNEFYRLRVGIGQKKKTKQAMEMVLKKFSAKETDEMKKVIKKTCDAIICTITESPDKAMTIYNQS